jgi:hypothetical protein
MCCALVAVEVEVVLERQKKLEAAAAAVGLWLFTLSMDFPQSRQPLLPLVPVEREVVLHLVQVPMVVPASSAPWSHALAGMEEVPSIQTLQAPQVLPFHHFRLVTMVEVYPLAPATPIWLLHIQLVVVLEVKTVTTMQ